MSADCIFCKIASGKIPAEKVYENDDVVAFKDLHPVAPTHILIIPKMHYPTVHEVPSDKLSVFTKLYEAVGEIVKKMNIADSGYRTVINTNRMAGQEVFHLHLHILGGRQLSKMG